MSTVTSPTSSTSSTASSTNAWNSLTPQDFINMLVAELQNQDPTQPVDNTQILQQVGQIENIVTNENLNTTLESVALEQSMSTATSLLQKTITAVDASGNTITGPVSSISVSDGTVTVSVNGTSVPFSDITSISSS